MRNRMIAALVTLSTVGCMWQPEVPARSQPVVAGDGQSSAVSSERGKVAIVELASGFEHPWSLAFLPDGRMLVTERPGRLLLLEANGKFVAEIAGLPAIFVDGQAGLLDVVPSPDFASDHRIYLSFAKANLRGNLAGTAVYRGELKDHALVDGQVIYEQEPKLSSGTTFPPFRMGSPLSPSSPCFLFNQGCRYRRIVYPVLPLLATCRDSEAVVGQAFEAHPADQSSRPPSTPTMISR
jgi:glucose/arabinose dehydrogenase